MKEKKKGKIYPGLGEALRKMEEYEQGLNKERASKVRQRNEKFTAEEDADGHADARSFSEPVPDCGPSRSTPDLIGRD